MGKSKKQIASELPLKQRKELYKKLLASGSIDALAYEWAGWLARPEQVWPDGDWSTWLIMAGRGWGKTRTGAEAIREAVWRRDYRRVAIVGRTAADVRDTMLYGVSGLMECGPKHERPEHRKSDRALVWPNGAVGITYTADEPDQLRGPNHDIAWEDEPAAWRYPEAHDNLLLGLRLGQRPVTILTTTPRPTKMMIEIAKEKTTHITKGTSYDNRANLAPTFFDKIIKRYEGTTLGRQEIYAELLLDIQGALWKIATIDRYRVQSMPSGLVCIAVGVDPMGSVKSEDSETGIVVVGRDANDHYWVLDDVSIHALPLDWAQAVINAYDRYSANRIVVETNYGGDMVISTIQSVRRNVGISKVTATRGKILRAEPAAALYEQGRIHHVGNLATLENEMITYTGNPGERSPNRLDALVWAVTSLSDSFIDTSSKIITAGSRRESQL